MRIFHIKYQTLLKINILNCYRKNFYLYLVELEIDIIIYKTIHFNILN
jgi:hypothetical protein